MTHYFIIPGLGNSGPEHWQTYFEKTSDTFHRIVQEEWDAPRCSEWVSTIDKAISGYDLSTVILISHSLGCVTIAHWANQYNKKVKGALLVTPSDVESLQYTSPAKGFDPMPKNKINFPTIVVASTDDPWVSLDRAKFFADNWGSQFINIGKAGHVNVSSGNYKWEQGQEILKTLG
jgi:uncharacterized protein